MLHDTAHVWHHTLAPPMQTFSMEEAACILLISKGKKKQEQGAGRSLTRHSVCPELVVVDVAKHHEEHKADYVRPIEDLQVASREAQLRSQLTH